MAASMSAETAAERGATTVTIDLRRLQDAGYIVPQSPRSPMADAFRMVKRKMLSADGSNTGESAGAPGRASLIGVTSALPGEGKTFCAINLAMSMAMEVDIAVLLVDADVLRPSVLPRLGLRAERGLIDVLCDPSICLSSVVLRTNVPNLAILPAGTPNDRSHELLASAAMKDLLSQLAATRSNFVVIFDSPAMLLTTESRVLASQMGQVLMVVQADKTLRSDVEEALAALEGCPVQLVLNQASPDNAYGRYGYGYEDYGRARKRAA